MAALVDLVDQLMKLVDLASHLAEKIDSEVRKRLHDLPQISTATRDDERHEAIGLGQ